MPFPPPRESTNLLLERLPAAERKRVLTACERVEVVLGEVIYEQGGNVKHAYFPLDSMFSELTPSSDPPVEAFLVGREGMVGFLLALGTTQAPMHCSIQGSGGALRIPAADFRREAQKGGRLQKLAFGCVTYQLQQTARNVYCVKHHEIVARLARWLMMAMDRHQSRRFVVTHKFLAAMLGSRRAGVTVAASALQLRGLIRYRRGEIEVLDREGLEDAACDCYAFTLEAQERVNDA
jgi:CRP-like cAMP-binding protein